MVVSADTLQLGVVRQVAPNVVPATPAFKLMRITGEGLTFNPTTTESSELDARRAVSDSILTGGEVSGEINFELSKNEAFELLMEGVLCSQWGAAGSSGATPAADELYVGTELLRHLIEKNFLIAGGDHPINSYHRFLDCVVNSFSLSITPNEPITGSFNLIGSKLMDPAETAITGATYAEAGVNPIFTAPLVTDITLDRASGTDIAIGTYCFNSLNISINNNVRALTCIGYLGTKDSVLGKCQVGIDASIYFADDEILKAFLANEEFSLKVRMEDPLPIPKKHVYEFFFPRVKMTAASVTAGGSGQDVVVETSMVALLPSSSPFSQVKVTRETITTAPVISP